MNTSALRRCRQKLSPVEGSKKNLRRRLQRRALRNHERLWYARPNARMVEVQTTSILEVQRA